MLTDHLRPRVWRSLCAFAFLIGQGSLHAQGRAQTPLPLDDLQALSRAMSIIRSDYVVERDQSALIGACIKGMVASLDGDSSYQDKKSMAELRRASNGEVAGVGLELAMQGGFPVVVTSLAGSPAERAGLQPRDVIVDIDGDSTEDMPLGDIVSRLRGDVGSSVTVTVRGAAGQASRPVTMSRAIVVSRPARARMVAPGVALLRVQQFLDDTASVAISELDILRRKGELKGLVLDLRNSPGGLLFASLEMAAMLLPEDALIASTNGRLAEAKNTFRANRNELAQLSGHPLASWPAYLRSVPMVVLVNGGTASGAEIVAGALKDHRRAQVVGSKTFGRGSIQTIRPLGPDSAIRLTTANVMTPSGQSFHRKGLEPDVLAPDLQSALDVGTVADKAMLKALDILAGKV